MDSTFQKLFLKERNFLRELLKILLDITMFLVSRNLPFRGSSSMLIGDPDNGNFLGLIELLAKYGPFLREYTVYVKSCKDKHEKIVHYLSWRAQNEFLSLCGEKILKKILEERQEAVYFSFICDATPDVSRMEQNILILRYVLFNEEQNEWQIHERFLEYFDFQKRQVMQLLLLLLMNLESMELIYSTVVVSALIMDQIWLVK